MEKGHSQNTDLRPKRRIDKDNPYRLFTVGAATSEPHYFIQFKDGTGTEHCLEIEKSLFDLFDQFELDDLSYMNEVDNNHEHSELSEETLNRRAFLQCKSTEEIVLDDLTSEELHSAILRLPAIQRKRLILYFYDGMTQQEIADMEKCGQVRVLNSISAAINNLKNILTWGG